MQTINSKGEIISSKTVAKGNGQATISGQIGKKSYSSVKNSNGTAYKKTIDGETMYWFEGKQVKDPTLIDKLQIKLDISNSKILDSQIPALGENTNPFLMGAGTLEWLEEMEK